MKLLKTNLKTLFFLLALSYVTSSFGQTKENNDEKPYIEVTGSAELEIIPDEIYINIIIQEKYVNKEKVTIESQEEKLKTQLKDIGIDIRNFYLSDVNADYVKVKWRTKDVLTKKDYTLKVSNATKVGQVFQQLEKLEITDAYISKVNHSKLDSLRKEVKIMAIKAAKNKAEYLLTAIGEQLGKPIIIEERESGYNNGGAANNFRANHISNVKITGSVEKEEEFQFKKIKLEASIYIKFAIK